MSRKATILISLGISMALISAGLWFFPGLHPRFVYGSAQWNFPHHMMYEGGGWGIVMILFWIVLIAAVVLVVSGIVSGNRSSDGSETHSSEDALDILKVRYAKGEIDKSQFEEMKHDIKS